MNRQTIPGFDFTEDFVASRLQSWPIAEGLKRLQSYEDTGLDPDQIATMQAANKALENDVANLTMNLESAEAELAAYRQAEAEGRIVVLPAAIGSTVYIPSGNGGFWCAYTKEIAFLQEGGNAVMKAVVHTNAGICEYFIAKENKGTHWFTTEESARAAIERGE